MKNRSKQQQASAFPELTRAQLEELCLRQNQRVQELLAALKLALPYVEKIAATVPTEMHRQQRQRQACTDANITRAAIAKAEGR